MDDLGELRRLLANARARARYWSGAPSHQGRGYNPALRSGGDADAEYEMAMDDVSALADAIASITGSRPKVSDPKEDYKRNFAAGVLPLLSQ